MLPRAAGSGLSDMFGGLSLGIPAAAVAAGSSMDHREDPHQSPMIPAGSQRLGQQAGLPAGQTAHQQPAPAVQRGGAGLDDIFGGLALGGERWPGTVAPRLSCFLRSVSLCAARVAALLHIPATTQQSVHTSFLPAIHEHALPKLHCLSMVFSMIQGSMSPHGASGRPCSVRTCMHLQLVS